MRYEYYSKQAVKDGYIQISKIFQETADNEKQHAKTFYKFLNDEFCGQELEMEATIVAITLGTTVENLKTAVKGENHETTSLYVGFADVAEKEGFPLVADKFRNIAEVENGHEIRFGKLLENIEKGRVFKRDKVVKWKCDNCGYIHEGKEAPEKCPACDHPRDYYQIFKEEY